MKIEGNFAKESGNRDLQKIDELLASEVARGNPSIEAAILDLRKKFETHYRKRLAEQPERSESGATFEWKEPVMKVEKLKELLEDRGFKDMGLTGTDVRYSGKLVQGSGKRFRVFSLGDTVVAVPGLDYMASMDEISYYRGVFDCESPMAGQIFVIRPVEMQKDDQDGVWSIKTPGKIEVRR